MSPSFSISVPDDCRVSWVSFSRSRIISSTVIVADDGAEVAGEDVVDPLVHLCLLVEEASGGVGDGHVVVADLVDDHAADAERDALVGDALDGEVGLAQVEREPAHGLHARQHELALAGDDA